MLKSKTFFHFSRSIVTKADLNTNYTLISKPTLLHHKERAITSQSSASLPIRLATTLYTFTPQTHVHLRPKSDNWPPPTLAASARLPHAWRTTCECFCLFWRALSLQLQHNRFTNTTQSAPLTTVNETREPKQAPTVVRPSVRTSRI